MQASPCHIWHCLISEGGDSVCAMRSAMEARLGIVWLN